MARAFAHRISTPRALSDSDTYVRVSSKTGVNVFERPIGPKQQQIDIDIDIDIDIETAIN